MCTNDIRSFDVHVAEWSPFGNKPFIAYAFRLYCELYYVNNVFYLVPFRSCTCVCLFMILQAPGFCLYMYLHLELSTWEKHYNMPLLPY